MSHLISIGTMQAGHLVSEVYTYLSGQVYIGGDFELHEVIGGNDFKLIGLGVVKDISGYRNVIEFIFKPEE